MEMIACRACEPQSFVCDLESLPSGIHAGSACQNPCVESKCHK